MESFVKVLKRTLPAPVMPGKRQKTHGRWRDDDGRVRGEITSGELDNLSDDALELIRGLGFPEQAEAMAAHVEMKLAVIMRRESQSHATLVINNRPCGFDRADWRYACDKLLPQVLYPGQRMTVEGMGPNGEPFSRTYEGGSHAS
ncbi:DddA-like double-stranded DNA deaminase toxin [Longispora urticae]